MLDLEEGVDRKVLEELIYDRVRLAIDVEELDAFAEDLSLSVGRALDVRHEDAGVRGRLALELIETVWARATADVLEELITHEVGRVDEEEEAADERG